MEQSVPLRVHETGILAQSKFLSLATYFYAIIFHSIDDCFADIDISFGHVHSLLCRRRAVNENVILLRAQ